MPPRSPAATSVVRIASSRLVLPWSTWPMTVTIGARGCEERRIVLLEEDFLRGGRRGALLVALGGRAGGRRDRLGDLVAELAGDERRGVAVDQLVDRREDAALDQLADHVRRVDGQQLGELLDGDRRRAARSRHAHAGRRPGPAPERHCRRDAAASSVRAARGFRSYSWPRAPPPSVIVIVVARASSDSRSSAGSGASSARPRAPRSSAVVQQPASRQR